VIFARIRLIAKIHQARVPVVSRFLRVNENARTNSGADGRTFDNER
jgi:hypothetical protein